jgi:RND superfamily putative drug exporter
MAADLIFGDLELVTSITIPRTRVQLIKTQQMSVFLYNLGRACVRHRWRTIGAWLVGAVVLIGLSSSGGGELGNAFEVPGLDSTEAFQLLEEALPDGAGISANVIVQGLDGSTLDSAENQAAIGQIVQAMDALEETIVVVPPVPQQTIGPDGTIGLIQVRFAPDVEATVEVAHVLQEAGDAGAGDVIRIEYGGDLYSAASEPQTGVGEQIGLLMAVVVLLVAFGSIVAMGLPILTALFGLALGIGGGMGIVAIFMEVPVWAPSMIGMIGLGVGIDYALFVVTRFREGLADGLTIEDAAGRSNATAGLSVIFAGGTVMIAILGLAIAGIPFMTAAAVATSVTVLLMILSSITILPALMGWAGHRVNSKRARRILERQEQAVTEDGMWQRWGMHVSNHAWPYAIGTFVLLVTLTLPILSLELGFPDSGNQPADSTARQAYDLSAEAFGPGFNGPLVIAVDLTKTQPGEIEALTAAIAADPGIAAIQPPLVGETALALVAYPNSSPQDQATIDTISRLRTELFPSVLSADAAHVGGVTASFSDVAEKLQGRMVFFIAAVILLSFVLLVLVFRSILVPLKAALLNLLSIGAAYGVLVAVFQWGWAKDIVGLEETIPIVSFIPMFMFAILFGLSMDYEVFLLSRVKEEYLQRKDNTQSVIFGIANTARVITSAALIMISVFLGFVTNPDPMLKMMGLGLATAIFVDATIVRVILVPATMKLMGDANWWFPSWLEWLPRLDIEGEAGLPEREYELREAPVEAPEPQPA